jgi:hypothetical protein
MRNRLASVLFWDKRISNRLAGFLIAAILVAPLALAVAWWLELRIVAHVAARVSIDRGAAERIAREFAASQNIDTTGWSASISAERDLPIYKYLQAGSAGGQLMATLQPWGTVSVRLRDPGGSRNVRVNLFMNGEIRGHSITPKPAAGFGTRLREAEAVSIAGAFLAKHSQAASQFLLSDPTTKSAEEGITIVAWKVSFAGLPGLTGSRSVEVSQGQIRESSFNLELSEEARRSLPSMAAQGTVKSGHDLFLFILFFYILVRYLRRRAHEEVSSQRMYVVALLTTASLSAMILLSDEMLVLQDQDLAVPFAAIVFAVFLTMTVAGLAAGVVYAACEGDLRETYPRLLTSLDALLSGRLFSRNAGRSVVLGAAFLFLVLLAQNSVYLAALPEFPRLEITGDSLKFLFAPAPWLALLIRSLGFAIFLSLALLLGPLTALERLVGNRRLRLALLFLLVWLGIFAREAQDTGLAVALLLNLIQVAGLGAAFFLGDFLASMVFIAGHVFFFRLVDLGQIAPFWRQQDNWPLLVALGTLAVAAICAFRGRVAREEDVRPRYAREIHERLELQSEAQAARIAQLRLLPASVPSVPGYHLGATCLVAEEVSGDFYDFLPMSGGRLGVFLADGGSNGLATALSIALAKGYLMHKAHTGSGPVEMLGGLQELLGHEIQVETEGFCLAVLDPADGSFRYARLGETPGLLLVGAGEPSELLHRVSGKFQIVEGFCRLSPSSRLILYTNGLSRAAGQPDAASTGRWLTRRLSSQLDQPPQALIESFLKKLLARPAGLGRRKAQEDVTLVAISVDPAFAGTMERVA